MSVRIPLIDVKVTGVNIEESWVAKTKGQNIVEVLEDRRSKQFNEIRLKYSTLWGKIVAYTESSASNLKSLQSYFKERLQIEKKYQTQLLTLQKHFVTPIPAGFIDLLFYLFF